MDDTLTPERIAAAITRYGPAPDGIPIERHIRNMEWSEREHQREWHPADDDEYRDTIWRESGAMIVCVCGNNHMLYDGVAVTCDCGRQFRYVCVIETREDQPNV